MLIRSIFLRVRFLSRRGASVLCGTPQRGSYGDERALHIINTPPSNTMQLSEMSDPVRRPAHRLSTPRRRFNAHIGRFGKSDCAWAKCEFGGGARV
jgi:hypothetical protein